MLLYFFTFLFFVLLLLLEHQITGVLSRGYHSIAKFFTEAWFKFRNMDDRRYYEGFRYSDDIFAEMSFKSLYTEFVRVKKEKQRFMLLKSKGAFSVHEIKRYINRYLMIIERNEKSIKERLVELTDAHIDKIEGIDPDLMTAEDQIKTVLEYYNQSIDKNNPMRDACVVEEYMHGRMHNQIHSFDLMDNPKYARLE